MRITSSMNRTGSSNIASPQVVVEARETFAIDGVVFLKTAEVEPVAGELRRQAARTFVFQHPAGLRDQDIRLLQIAARGQPQKFLVRHARPEEIAQPAGQSVAGQRLRAPVRSLRPADFVDAAKLCAVGLR